MSTIAESSDSTDEGSQQTIKRELLNARNGDAGNASLDYKGKRVQYWTTVIACLTAIVTLVSTVVLLFKTGDQTEDIDSLHGRIDSLQRINGDRAEQISTLEDEVASLRTARDNAITERDAALAELEEAHAGESAPGVVTDTAPEGSDVRKYVLAASSRYDGTALDLDEGVVQTQGADLRYKLANDGRQVLDPEYQRSLSDKVEANPDASRCKEAVERYPLAQDDYLRSFAANKQFCIESDFGISLLTITAVAENGDLSVTQIYWPAD